MRTEAEIAALQNLAAELEDEPDLYPGMTYQRTVLAVLQWVVGDIDDPLFEPLEDDNA